MYNVSTIKRKVLQRFYRIITMCILDQAN